MKTEIFFVLLLFGIGLISIPFWPDPDGIGTYNSVCKGANEFLPSLTQKIMNLILCDIIEWKKLQLFIILLVLFLLYRFSSLSIMGLIGFLPIFLLSFEDDLLAFPLILLYAIYVIRYQEKTIYPPNPLQPQNLFPWIRGLSSKHLIGSHRLRLILLGIFLSIFLGFYVWKGSFLIGLILVAFLIHPILSVLPSIVYIILNNFNNWGGSSEAIIGYGFMAGQIGLLLILFDWWKNGFRFQPVHWLFLSMEFLVLFQPKWGEWLIIPFIPLMAPILLDRRVRFFGYWMLFLTIVFTIFTVFPMLGELNVVQTAVLYQTNGYVVINDWGIGHYFEYYGGKPSQKGGYAGFQDANKAYWLGPERECETITYSNALFFQKC